MFELNQIIYHTGSYPTIPITRHVIDEKIKIVDGDGKEKYIYHLTDYAVYFPEEELINEFSIAIEHD